MSYPGRLVTLDGEFSYVVRIRTSRLGDGTRSGIRVGSPLALVGTRRRDARCVPTTAPKVCIITDGGFTTRFHSRAGRVSAIELDNR